MARPAINVCDSQTECILANFTNGRLVPDAADHLKFAQYKYNKAEHRHKSKQTLVCESDKLQYIGHNTGPGAHRNTAKFRYMIGAFNRRLGKVRLYKSQVFRMHPHFPDDDKEDVDDTDMTFREKNDELTSAFGGVRKRRAMELRRKNMVQGKSLQAAMSSAVDNVLSKSDAASITAQPQVDDKMKNTIPSCNLEATEPAAVYHLDTIISSVVMVAIKGPSQEFLNVTREDLVKWTKDKLYSTYILKHLAMMPIDPSSRSHKAACLMYLNYMMKMYQMNPIKYKQSAFSQNIPSVVEQSLLNMFTIEAMVGPSRISRRCMPARLKDMLLAYICVVSLILDEYSLEYADLMVDLAIGQAKIVKTFRSLGCFVQQQKSQSGHGIPIQVGRAILKIPLSFPKQRPKSSKMKR